MKRVFLLGDPVAHSISPAMHNAAFGTLGLDWQYELLETPKAELAQAIGRFRAVDCAGANVTIPYKEDVVHLLDEVTDRAHKIGAVNTIFKRAGQLIGDNTDGYGVTRALLDARVGLQDRRIAILGAGGAAHAVAVTMAELGAARIVILNRTVARAEKLAAFLRSSFPTVAIAVNDVNALLNSDLIVNATSVGMTPREDESPMWVTFPRGAVALDLVYRPIETHFLSDAARVGAQTVGGIGMLVHQGAAAFKLWTGRDAPVDRMFDAARHALNGV